MTPSEIRTEKHYRIEERLGILCGSANPTPEQLEIANREADEWEAIVTWTASPRNVNEPPNNP